MRGVLFWIFLHATQSIPNVILIALEIFFSILYEDLLWGGPIFGYSCMWRSQFLALYPKDWKLYFVSHIKT